MHSIPKQHFAQSFADLVEMDLKTIANKFYFILSQVVKSGKSIDSEFGTLKEKLQIHWSLLQLERAIEDDSILNDTTFEYLNSVNTNDLTAEEFHLYKQVACLALMYEFQGFDQQKVFENLTSEKSENLTEELGMADLQYLSKTKVA